MKIGFLHLGPKTHGVRRFGEHLAQAMKTKPDIEISEWSFNQWNEKIPFNEMNRTVDLLYCQYNAQAYSSIWGRLGKQVKNLTELYQEIKIPVVFTLHDIYQPGYQSFSDKFKLIEAIKFWISPQRKALKLIIQNPVIVNSKEEARRLNSIFNNIHATVIPHFIKVGSKNINKADAKKKLGIRGKKIIIIRGFIHPRKGHDIAVETMKYLSDDYVLIIAGGSTQKLNKYQNKLVQLIETEGLENRVRITGYLSEEDLSTVLAAADLAILPCRNVSASGSLGTLLSVKLPVITSDLPLFREYIELDPNVLSVIPELNPRILADEIIDRLSVGTMEQIPNTENLNSYLNIDHIIQKYITFFSKLKSE